ncbi:MAG TPA: hypothetical protein VF875_12940 [Anaeromyxobacter sp.]
MRRLLPLLAGFAAVSCATAPKPAKDAAALAAEVRTPPGFEKVPNEILTEYDLTHDGKPDVWKYSLKDAAGKETLLRKEKDLNGDGKIDTWEKYAPDGALVRVVYDLDFDGKPDVTLYYEKDQLVKKELAFGFDGVPRTTYFYEKGKLVRKERDTNGDGQVDVWEYWENGEIDRIGYDTDGDGQVDRWEARKGPGGAEPAAAPAQAATPAPSPAAAPAQK